MEVKLRVTSGPHIGREQFLILPGRFVVGRSSNVGLPMQQDRRLLESISRWRLESSVCSLKDLGSTNGTRVNGLRVENIPLRDGDVITAGESAFQVLIEHSNLDSRSSERACQGCGHILRSIDLIGGKRAIRRQGVVHHLSRQTAAKSQDSSRLLDRDADRQRRDGRGLPGATAFDEPPVAIR